MTKRNRKIPKKKIVELAEQFSHELDQKLPVTVLPNGGIIYKDYLIKSTDKGNWTVHQYKQKQYIGEFYLKTCALMAAKAYDGIRLEKFNEIKRLDTQYWANHSDTQIFKRNIKLTKEFERYLILLNRLEESQAKEQFYKDEISRMFKWSFV